MRPITRRGFAARLAAALSMALPNTSRAQGNATGKAVGTGSAQPITIGFAEALTGGLAAVGKSGILAMQIWAEDVNAKGGLLGRPVKLVFYDNQSNPANVPGIYVKLLEIDRVDMVISGYSTNMTAPAMPVVMGHNKLFVSLFCLAVNTEFHYPRYFSMLPVGPDPKHAFSQLYCDLAMTLTPKPKTVAIVAADAEFARNASDGARDNAKAAGLKVVYDSTYPPTTADYSPIVRAVRAANADIIYVASYPPDTAGILRAASEIGLEAQLFGGGMVGVATAALKTQLGPLLNGVVVQQNWVPAPTLQYPGVMEFLARYRSRAAAAGVDPLGVFLPPWAYARMQVLQQAIEAVGSIDDAKLATYLGNHTFHTVIGDVAFGTDGEWAAPRMIVTQFQNINGNGLEQFQDTNTEIVLLPAQFGSGKLVYPYRSTRS
jgi:branched-chain amino acid transport system substrate-binding protein